MIISVWQAGVFFSNSNSRASHENISKIKTNKNFWLCLFVSNHKRHNSPSADKGEEGNHDVISGTHDKHKMTKIPYIFLVKI